MCLAEFVRFAKAVLLALALLVSTAHAGQIDRRADPQIMSLSTSAPSEIGHVHQTQHDQQSQPVGHWQTYPIMRVGAASRAWWSASVGMGAYDITAMIEHPPRTA